MRRGMCLLLAASARLLADGGTIILHQQAPPYVVTVFASPAPPRAGTLDLSVLLQKSETLAPVLDADIWIEIQRDAIPMKVHAEHERAQNKLLHAATVRLEEPGTWRYTVLVETAALAKPLTVSGQIAVFGEPSKLVSHVGYLVLPFVLLAIFALHQWLRDRPNPANGI